MNNNTLKNFMEEHDVNKDSELVEYQKLFYKLDRNMKRLHEAGYSVGSFDTNDIFVDSMKFNVVFEDRMEDKKHSNIYDFANLAIKIYSSDNDTFDKLKNTKITRDNYREFREFIPNALEPYYRGIIERDAEVYLSDFMRAKRDREMAKEKQELSQANRSLNKSTLAGRLYSDDENKNAFVLIYLFPAIIFFLAILIPILIILT